MGNSDMKFQQNFQYLIGRILPISTREIYPTKLSILPQYWTKFRA